MSTLLEQASLVLIPSGYKEDTVYSVIPSNGTGDMSFTRASDGTRINSDGLVENTPWNILRYSEQFNNGVWVLFASGTGVNPIVTANTTIAPNETLTADTIVLNAGAGTTASDQSQIYQTFSNVIGNIYTVSFYAKGIVGGEQLMIRHARGSTYTKITLTNQWERYSVTETSTYTGTGFLEILIRRGQNEPINASATFFIWGAQLNIGSTAKPYFPTTDRLNVPRLTYQNAGGGCPSLLLEPQRTNNVLRSEEFDNSAWVKSNSTITANSTTSPDGTQNADTLNVTAIAYSGVYNLTTYSLASGVYTQSIYAKKGTKNFIYFLDLAGTGAKAWYNLNTGVLGTISSGYTATITNAGNGWYRCTLTETANRIPLFFQCGASDTDNSFTPTSSGTIFIWGAQLELGSYSSSYIPTTSSSATRIADVCSKTGISSLIGQTEGVLFTDFVCNGFQDYGTPLSVNNGSRTQFIWIATFANGNIRAELYNGAVQASITYTGGVIGQRYKLAFAYKTNDFAMYVNGSLVGTDVSGTTFSGTTLSRLDFDTTNSAIYSLSLIKVNQAILFKTRLTNSELAQITTI